ncbi:MAG TPA: hypothetical protein VMF88_11175 [Bacteroidota bacterium]|nr:hypothetical protein [Bacteroidota bacterium]
MPKRKKSSKLSPQILKPREKEKQTSLISFVRKYAWILGLALGLLGTYFGYLSWKPNLIIGIGGEQLDKMSPFSISVEVSNTGLSSAYNVRSYSQLSYVKVGTVNFYDCGMVNLKTIPELRSGSTLNFEQKNSVFSAYQIDSADIVINVAYEQGIFPGTFEKSFRFKAQRDIKNNLRWLRVP